MNDARLGLLNWTQSIQLSPNVADALDHGDIVLRDQEGTPIAVLVKVDRYKP